jgi:hypothetical protein
MLRVQRFKGFDQDEINLDSIELRNLLLGLIWELSNQFRVPKKPLKKMKHTGDLRGIYSVRFDIQGYHNRYRLVFDYLPKDEPAEILRLIAVGPRFGDWVYKAAANRLNS